ncbi:MAG: hypothetical protein GX591_08445 [Planctomycetes bacterium]|nr:hypothetical protein [Planctomycetota bacterium]
MSTKRLSPGSTLLLTFIFLALFTTLAIAFHTATNMSFQQANSLASLQRAQLAAESGLAHILMTLRTISVSGSDTGAEYLADCANHLAAAMDGKPNLGDETIEGDYDANGIIERVRVPRIAVRDTGDSYDAQIVALNDDNLAITVHGRSGRSVRTLYIELDASNRRNAVFDYGVASRSKIVMTGNARILSASDDDPHWADILSATYTDPEAVKLTGNPTIEGDISTCDPASHVSVTGNPDIGGETNWEAIQAHIHTGIGDVEFPEVDPTVFEPFATNIVNSSTGTSGNKVFENIRIAAGTNPTFSGNITIRGVVFIEAPNRVQFTGNLNFTGVIVTEDAGEDVYDTNTIRFTGNMSSQGVEDLPDTPQFAELREMPGSMLLAPGFGVHFTGNFGTVNGAMAADRFVMTGNSGGTVHGPIICYSDSDFTMTGNAHFTIDRSRYQGDPPGFAQTSTMVPAPDTYREL